MTRMEGEDNGDNVKRISVRVPADLADEYDETVGNRSEAIRAHMKNTVKQPRADGGRVPPRDDDTLAQAYNVLREIAGDAGVLPVREAESIVASKANVPKDSVSRRVLKPLRDRGYLSRMGDPIQDPWLEVR